MKVFLNPDDLKLLCSYLDNCSEEDLFSQGYLIRDDKNGVSLPRILFRTLEGIQFCPFLENRLEEDGSLKGLCLLHPDFKPLVCHLAPLTRTVDFEDDSESYGFVLPHPYCPGCNQVKEGSEVLSYKNLPEDIKSRLDREKEFFRSLWLAPDD
jgi:Fe-S-cluster containining protein